MYCTYILDAIELPGKRDKRKYVKMLLSEMRPFWHVDAQLQISHIIKYWTEMRPFWHVDAQPLKFPISQNTEQKWDRFGMLMLNLSSFPYHKILNRNETALTCWCSTSQVSHITKYWTEMRPFWHVDAQLLKFPISHTTEHYSTISAEPHHLYVYGSCSFSALSPFVFIRFNCWK
jgi:uncharacterized protein YbdZ (MbtH family)